MHRFVMRFIAVCVIALAGLGSSAWAQTDRPLDMVRDLEGHWELDMDRTPVEQRLPGYGDCSINAVRIWLSSDGGRYYSQFESESFTATSPVHRHFRSEDGHPGIVISYENIYQPDPYGAQIIWHLVLINTNEFHWYKETSDGVVQFDSVFRRCAFGMLS